LNVVSGSPYLKNHRDMSQIPNRFLKKSGREFSIGVMVGCEVYSRD